MINYLRSDGLTAKFTSSISRVLLRCNIVDCKATKLEDYTTSPCNEFLVSYGYYSYTTKR